MDDSYNFSTFFTPCKIDLEVNSYDQTAGLPDFGHISY